MSPLLFLHPLLFILADILPLLLITAHILAGWPTNFPYDSHHHLDFLNEIVFPYLDQLASLDSVRVLSFGTCLEYNGTSSSYCLESDSVSPTCNLGLAKSMLTDKLSSLNLDFTHLRIFYPYNFDLPRENSILWHLSRHLELTPDKPFPCSLGLQYRDYFHVSLLSRVIALYLSSPSMAPPILNVCSGNPLMIRQLLHSYLTFEVFR